MSDIVSYDEMLTEQMNYVWFQGFKVGAAFGGVVVILICTSIL